MDPPSLAASAADAAGLGVQFAQDLYHIGSEYPTVESQIGRIAQAFLDLNLTLDDLAAALPSPQDSACLSQHFVDRLGALVARIHKVQKTLQLTLNNEPPAASKGGAGKGKKPGSRRGTTTSSSTNPSTSKLDRLKAAFPGPSADDRFTEMEWMRNTLALLAAVVRLAAVQRPAESSPTVENMEQSSHIRKQRARRVAAETLTSAVIIYVHTIEKLLEGSDADDSDDDDESITGPGSLLFAIAPSPAPSKASVKLKSSWPTNSGPIVPDRDAADWVYDALRKRIKQDGRAGQTSSEFVDWLLDEVVDKTDPPEPLSKESNLSIDDDINVQPSTADHILADNTTAKDKEVESGVQPADTEPFPALPSKKSVKKKGKKGKINDLDLRPASKPTDIAQSGESVDVSSDTTLVKANDDDKAITVISDKDNAARVPSTYEVDGPSQESSPPPEMPNAPEVPSFDNQTGEAESAQYARHADLERPRDSKFDGRQEAVHDHEDLPPPYHSPDAVMPPGRGPPFPSAHYPFPPVNPMAYPPPAAGYDEYANVGYMPPQPPMFHPLGYYPMHAPYMPSQPFYRGRPPPAEAYSFGDPYDNHFSTRPMPGMRRGSMEQGRRDTPNYNSNYGTRAGALVSRRPRANTGTVLNAAIFGDYDEEQDGVTDDGMPRDEHRGMRARRRTDSHHTQSSEESKEIRPTSMTSEKYGSADKPDKKGKRADVNDDTAQAESEEELHDRVDYKGKKAAYPVKQEDKADSGLKKSAAKANDVESDAEAVDMRNMAPIRSNSCKKRNQKTDRIPRGKSTDHSDPPSLTPSPVTQTHLPAPPTPSSAHGGDRHDDDDFLNTNAKKAVPENPRGKARVLDESRDKTPKYKKNEMEKGRGHDNTDSSNEDEVDDDNDAREHDADDQNKDSPGTESRVFTPPPTPPEVLHSEEVSPQPHASHARRAPAHANGASGNGLSHDSSPTDMSYYPTTPFMQQPHPSMVANPFNPRHGSSNDGHSYGRGSGIGATAAGDPTWASSWGENTQAPPTAWAAAAASAGTVMNGPQAPPAGPPSNWMRGNGHSTQAHGPAPRSRPPPAQRLGRYRSRTMYNDDDHDDDDRRGMGHGHSDYEEYDDEDDGDYRRRSHTYSQPYRRRSYSPQHDRRSYPAGPSRGRDGSADDGRGRVPVSAYHGGHPQQPYYPQPYPPPPNHQQHHHHQQSPPHQPPHQPQPYYAYYDQPPQRPLHSEKSTEWEWPGDVKQQPPPPVPPQPPLPRYVPAPPPKNGLPRHQGWDDNGYTWGETYRQAHGRAEYEMSEMDG